MPWCDTCPVFHCKHNYRNRPRPKNGHLYTHPNWGCPDNNIKKFNKHYHGEMTYAKTDTLDFQFPEKTHKKAN